MADGEGGDGVNVGTVAQAFDVPADLVAAPSAQANLEAEHRAAAADLQKLASRVETAVQEALAPAPEPTADELLAIERETSRRLQAEVDRLKRKAAKNARRPTLSSEARAKRKKILEEYPSIADDTAALSILDTALEAFDRMREAQREIREKGLTFKDRFGKPKANPATTIERDMRAQYLAGLKALNLDVEPLNAGPGRPPGD